MQVKLLPGPNYLVPRSLKERGLGARLESKEWGHPFATYVPVTGCKFVFQYDLFGTGLRSTNFEGVPVYCFLSEFVHVYEPAVRVRKFKPLRARKHMRVRVLAWRQVERFLLAEVCTRVFPLLLMSQKKSFSLKRKSFASDLCFRRAKILQSYPRCDPRHCLVLSQGWERKEVVCCASNAQKKIHVLQKSEPEFRKFIRKKREADPHSMEKRWKQKSNRKVNSQIFLPFLGLENKLFQGLQQRSNKVWLTCDKVGQALESRRMWWQWRTRWATN